MNRLDLNWDSTLSYFLYSTHTLKLKLSLTNYFFNYQDDTIHATIQKNNIKKFQTQLREGQLYSLSNFRVDTYKEKDSYRPISKENMTKLNLNSNLTCSSIRIMSKLISSRFFSVDSFPHSWKSDSYLPILLFIRKLLDEIVTHFWN